MILFVIVAAISLTAVVATLIAVARDGYGPVRTDPSRIRASRTGASRSLSEASPSHEPLTRSADVSTFVGAHAVTPTKVGKSAGKRQRRGRGYAADARR
ncbi:hypothetical protein FHX49_002421 [Microbacterium endophyticum]|uniref:Uncharacterized protein n=1 Tax=Microbacterium endophyticum TaxID=1526412 RepID=A0A7W4V5Y2_9MICO|nr:hypothetical protein [Microbacterium endophyticum]MBB2976833.1 hypothetical protein [Microbacterium endophyticum]NIK35849.1 hypothetical protein [Microbacterium endophyticum]